MLYLISTTTRKRATKQTKTRREKKEEGEEGAHQTAHVLKYSRPSAGLSADTCGDVTASVRGANTGPQPSRSWADTCGDVTASGSADTCGDRTASVRGATDRSTRTIQT